MTTYKHFPGGGQSHLDDVNSVWPHLIGRRTNSLPLHPLPWKRSGKREKNSVIKLWVMSGSHGWHPPPPLSLSPTIQLLSLSLFFLLLCLDTFLSRFFHLSLHPSTPLVISLSLLCCFASSFSTPLPFLPWFFFVCCHSFFPPLYAPPHTHTQ